MFPVIGSGGFITAPVITEKGQPILDPLVLQETNLGNTSFVSLRASWYGKTKHFKMIIDR